MEFNAINNIALIIIVFSVIKMLVLLIKPIAWMNFAKGVYVKPAVVKIVAFILLGVVFYYLHYVSAISVVQILAVTAFVALMFMIGLATEFEFFVKKFQALIKKGKLWKQYRLYTLLWLVLLGWAIKELFF